ncbi:TcpQ domain-containing protein [Escherichia coli]|uniref:TcpQ domain-containing protein n=1 Tax=Escherichia coli TaxID=562 RepID=UPI0038B23939
MKTRWNIAVLLSVLSFAVNASPVAPIINNENGKVKSPFSIDRHPDPSSVNERANIVNVKGDISLTLNENALLSQELRQWSESHSFKLNWRSDKDYIIYKTVHFNAKSKEDILHKLGELFSSEQYGLVMKLYAGNNVLVVDSQ